MRAQNDFRDMPATGIETEYDERGVSDREIRYKQYKEKPHLAFKGAERKNYGR